MQAIDVDSVMFLPQDSWVGTQFIEDNEIYV